jgi:asparagine synthase (glutamine-hydrolysing)
MCGICGIINFDQRPVEEPKLRKMMVTMKHRGPDDEGVCLHSNVGLGFVRLSILDLSPAGHQPMVDSSDRYVVVFNGEIYNYIELRDELKQLGVEFNTEGDTEVLLKSYVQYGEACLDKFNGMFAFVILDKQTGNVFGARDRFGVKPFYYYSDDSNLLFASEIPPILAVYGQKNKANEQLVFDFLTFNRTDHTEQTFFENIQKLQHGCCFSIKAGVFEIKKWYDLRNHIGKEKGDPDRFKDLLTSAVKLRMRSDVPVGVCLSGGLDSSAITSIIAGELQHPEINAFSAVYDKGVKADESAFIDLYKGILPNMYKITPTAESLFADLNNFVRIHAEPIPSTGPYAQYVVMKLAHEHVTVTLDGQGADEQLGGYHYFYGFYFKDLLKKFKLFTLLKECLAYYQVHHSIYAFKTFLYFLMPKESKTKLSVNDRGFLSKDFVEKLSQNNSSTVVNDLYASKSLNEALLNHFEFKLEHLLKWNDRNSMAYSLESRTPFLDYRLVEYTLSIDSASIIKNGFTKSILRESLRNILPEKIRVRRDKIGFATPQDEWYRTEMFQKFILDLLQSDSFKQRNLINPEVAMALYKKHLNRNIDISKEIWKWIHLELWFREFIDKSMD